MLELCQQKGPARLQAVLAALGEAEAVLAVSAKWRTEAFQRPIPLLTPQWLAKSNDDSPEFRLAASLAGICSPIVGDLRQHLEPVEIKGRLTEGGRRWADWSQNSGSACNVVWNKGGLEDNFIAVLQRRAVEAIRKGSRSDDATLVFPGESICFAAPGGCFQIPASRDGRRADCDACSRVHAARLAGDSFGANDGGYPPWAPRANAGRVVRDAEVVPYAVSCSRGVRAVRACHRAAGCCGTFR